MILCEAVQIECCLWYIYLDNNSVEEPPHILKSPIFSSRAEHLGISAEQSNTFLDLITGGLSIALISGQYFSVMDWGGLAGVWRWIWLACFHLSFSHVCLVRLSLSWAPFLYLTHPSLTLSLTLSFPSFLLSLLHSLSGGIKAVKSTCIRLRF